MGPPKLMDGVIPRLSNASEQVLATYYSMRVLASFYQKLGKDWIELRLKVVGTLKVE